MKSNGSETHLDLSPEPGSSDYTEYLLQCMGERLDLLRTLRTLADSQAQAAGQDDVDITLGLLARKQILLSELTRLQQRLRPYFHDDPEKRNWQSADRRKLCQQLANEGARLLQQCARLEKNALDEMTARREAVAAQLQDGKNSILASTAYLADNPLFESALDVSDL